MSTSFIQKTYSKINDSLNKSKQYVRILTLIICLLVIFALWSVLLMRPSQNKHKLLTAQKTTAEKIFKETQIKITEFAKNTAAKKASPMLQKKYADLKRELANMNKRLKDFDRKMVPISEMIAFLKAALIREHDLHLESVTTSPPVPLNGIRKINVPGKKVAVQPQQKNQLFKQSITLVFTGDYFHTLDYLQYLEDLKWRLFWDELHYKAASYPAGKITIKINTLEQTKAESKDEGKQNA